MKLVDNVTGLEVLPREECLRLLAEHCVGRLATIAGTQPHLVPVNYAMDGEVIVFRTDPGTKLDSATRTPVAFEIDEIDPATRTGWSVVVHGLAEESSTFDGPTRVLSLRDLHVDPWAGGEKLHWVRIEPLRISGRRITR